MVWSFKKEKEEQHRKYDLKEGKDNGPINSAVKAKKGEMWSKMISS